MTTVSDLFNLDYGHSLEFNRLIASDAATAINFVSRTTRNNGVSARIEPIPDLEPAKAGTITVALNGQGGAGEAFLQPFPYYTSFHLMVLTAKEVMTDLEKLWWARCITANRFRFGFGRQANKTLAGLVLPPVADMPDWVHTTNLTPFENADAPAAESLREQLQPSDWRPFRYDVLFEIKKGLRLTKASMEIGDTPFIGAVDSNNGYRQFVNAVPNHSGNTITVNYNGSVAEAFYQPAPFWASDDVTVLYPKFKMNSFIGLFFCVLIRREKFRYNYGRKWHVERMLESIIFLPVVKKREIDFAYMERLIKSLPYSGSVG